MVAVVVLDSSNSYSNPPTAATTTTTTTTTNLESLELESELEGLEYERVVVAVGGLLCCDRSEPTGGR